MQVQHLNQQRSICCALPVATPGGIEDALAPCQQQLDAAGESWEFLAQQRKTLWGTSQHLAVVPGLWVQV